MGKADASEADVAAAMRLLEQSGAKQAVESRVEALCGRADTALAEANLHERGRTLLSQLARKFAFREH